MTSKEYITHLTDLEEWDGNKENLKTISSFENDEFPNTLWVVEVSSQQLFPANERKLGEIVLDATRQLDHNQENNLEVFLMARLPGQYLVGNALIKLVPPVFLQFQVKFFPILHYQVFQIDKFWYFLETKILS